MTTLESLVAKYAFLSRSASEVAGSTLAMAKAYPCQTPIKSPYGETYVDVSRRRDDGEFEETDEQWCHNQMVMYAHDDVDRKPFEEYCDNCKRRSAVRNAVAYLRRRRGVAQGAIKRLGMRLAKGDQ